MNNSGRLRSLAGALGVLLLGLILTSGSRGQPKVEGGAGPKYRGAHTCIECHLAGPAKGAKRDDDFVLLTESATWSLQDKHSFAYLALKGPRSVEMGKILGIKDVSEDESCISCHAFRPKNTAVRFDHRVGVGCETCHGAADAWYDAHQEPEWRLKDPVWKQSEKGMLNLRDPATCAKVCMSCHVGSAAEGRVVTHAMYAAGHPPLPDFELALYRQNLPPHWREKRDVPFFKDLKIGGKAVDAELVRKLYQFDAADTQQARLVQAGSVEGVRCAMALTAQRADLASAEGLSREQREQRWPELQLKLPGSEGQSLPSLWPQVFMGQADCYACHHELSKRSWRQLRGSSGRPGRPQLRSWPFALPGQGIGFPDDVADFRKQVGLVEAACNERPFSEPSKLLAAARSVDKWTQDRVMPTPQPDEMVRKLCNLGKDQYPDYDSARQIAAALWVIYGEWAPKLEKGQEIRDILDKFVVEFDLQPYQVGRKDRIELVLSQVLTPKDRKTHLNEASLRGLLELSDRPLKKLSEKDQEAVRGLLAAFRDNAGAAMMDAILKDPEPFLLRMHAINERELAEAMSRVNKYDPFVFKERLKRLAELVPARAR